MMRQTSATTNQKDGKRGRTKENTGTNGKTEGIEMNGMGITKKDRKTGSI
jgi:hypothetical protein